MTRDEKGYVQFRCDWEPAAAPVDPVVAGLVAWRNCLRRLGLIGVYPDGIGYGNVSGRAAGGTFVISGTATGGLEEVSPEHFTKVTAYDLASNALSCRGPVRASSESLSHAAVYATDPAVGVVLHVHHFATWDRLNGVVPTTDPRAEAGTPGMAGAIADLLRIGVPDGLFVMGGHCEGLIAFGGTADEAGERLLAAVGPHGVG